MLGFKLSNMKRLKEPSGHRMQPKRDCEAIDQLYQQMDAKANEDKTMTPANAAEFKSI